MKISKLFHWLYAILMLLPFGLVLFNMLHGLFSPSATGLIDWDSFSTMIDFFSVNVSGSLVETIDNVYKYLIVNVFGLDTGDYTCFIIYKMLTYWTCVSIIWLVFDVFMYVPLLVHRWIDKAKLE